ncbi:MAG: rubrerythrin family protein [Chlorobium sp.]|nr:rubrerythrin family protein [Chlorobium phaeovibrioides]NQU46691.1 rubrerythrin family protein [Chlorobium sp.]
MTVSLQHLLDASIQLELNLAKLYTLFNDLFEEDEEFWWQLSMEERGHAALLQQEKKDPSVVFPENLLAKDLEALNESNERIVGLIALFGKEPPARADAFDMALELELSAGESHYQEFLDSPSESATANIFKQLNQEDRDHAERIRSYMVEAGIGS